MAGYYHFTFLLSKKLCAKFLDNFHIHVMYCKSVFMHMQVVGYESAGNGS